MLSKVLIGVLIAILGMGYWYYTITQTRISILTENNAKLETAAMISEQSIATLTQQAELNQQLTIQLQTDLQKAEAYGDNLRQKLRELDLLADALRDAANLEGRMNGATAKLWRDFMESTGSSDSKPLPNWLQPDPRTGSQGSNSDSESNSTDSSKAQTTPAS
jgi:hypothetical protein